MIDLPDDLIIEKVPIAKKYRSVTTGLVRRIKILYEAIYKKYGDEGLELIREVGEQYGLEIAERAKKWVKTNDLESVALYIKLAFSSIKDIVEGLLRITIQKDFLNEPVFGKSSPNNFKLYTAKEIFRCADRAYERHRRILVCSKDRNFR